MLYRPCEGVPELSYPPLCTMADLYDRYTIIDVINFNKRILKHAEGRING